MPHRGFTLIEVVVVVLLMAILAAVAAPKFYDKTEQAEQAAFIEELNVFVDAGFLFKADTGSYPMDSSSGALGNDGFADYVNNAQWTGGTPLGGVWDAERNSFGVASAIGVHFQAVTAKSNSFMTAIDTIIDDGDTGTGKFQRIAGDRYYYILQD